MTPRDTPDGPRVCMCRLDSDCPEHGLASPDDHAALRKAFRAGFQEGLAVVGQSLVSERVLALPKQRHEHPQTWCAACLVHSQAMAWLGKPLL